MKTAEEWIASKTRLAKKIVVTSRFKESDIRSIQLDAFKAGLEQAARLVANGSFLHDEAPTCQFAKEVVAMLNRARESATLPPKAIAKP